MRTGLGMARALLIGISTALVVALGSSVSIAAAGALAAVSAVALALLVEERRAFRRLWTVARAPSVRTAGELGGMDGPCRERNLLASTRARDPSRHV